MKLEPRRGGCLFKVKGETLKRPAPVQWHLLVCGYSRGIAWWQVCDTCWQQSPGPSWSGWSGHVHGGGRPYHDLTEENMVWKPVMGHLCVQAFSSVNVRGVLTALRDGSRGGQVSVLSVHVVSSTTRIIAQPDTKILYLQGRLLVDLNQATAAEL